MPDPAPAEIARRYTRRAFSVLRVAGGLADSASADVRRLGRRLMALVMAADLAEIGRRDAAALDRQIAELIASAYAAIGATQAEALRELLGIEAGWAAGVLRGTEPSDAMLERLARDFLALGAPVADQWGRQADALTRRVTDAVREAVAVPPEPAVLRSTMDDAIAAARRDAESLADLGAHSAAAQVRAEVARRSGAIGWQWFSILDMRTTTGCALRAGLLYTLDYQPIGHSIPIERPPPRHWGCRSQLLPLMRMPKPGDINLGSFDEWLNGLSQSEQDDVLGAGRADLYRRKVITKADLVNQRGRVLTLRELRARAD